MISDTSLLDAETDLCTRLLNNLPTGYSVAKVKFPNASFNTPTDQWLRVTNVALGIEELEASGRCELQTGLFVIDIFTTIGLGSKAALATAKQLKDLYHGQKFGVTSVSLVRVVPRPSETNWHHVEVNVEYDFQTIFTGV